MIGSFRVPTHPPPTEMKMILSSLSALSLGLLLPVTAQVTETKTETEIKKNPDGSVTESTTTTVTTFNPDARTKVVQYFDAYKTSPLGLPPGWAPRFKVKELPAAWTTTRIAPGVIVGEKERPFLVAAPPELIKVLPAPTGEVRYYVAGSNVVAVNQTYQVVDSIQIPTVKFVEVDDDDDDDDDNDDKDD